MQIAAGRSRRRIAGKEEEERGDNGGEDASKEGEKIAELRRTSSGSEGASADQHTLFGCLW